MKAISLSLFASAAISASASARDVRFADCPEPVRKAILSNSRDGRIDEVELIQRQGQTIYFAEIDLKSGRDLHLHLLPDGVLVRSIEEIRFTEVPEAVRAALEGLGGRVDDLERITEGAVVTYEAEIDRESGQPDLDVTVSTDGTILRRTEDHDDD